MKREESSKKADEGVSKSEVKELVPQESEKHEAEDGSRIEDPGPNSRTSKGGTETEIEDPDPNT
ncbi:hypothetical protein [Pendulispora albinea]|uniref:Uncharacterized protein n=1 Tax=Pendulispora albinea TaxID=2741071 RepID=A0ABZ2LTK9_9BACT